MHGERAGDGHALLLASRERVGIALSAIGKVERVERIVNALDERIVGDAQVFGTKGHVVQDGARHDLVLGVLRYAGALPAYGERALRIEGGYPPHAYGAACGRDARADQFEQGRFSRSVAAQYADVLPLLDGKRDIAEGLAGRARIGNVGMAEFDAGR